MEQPAKYSEYVRHEDKRILRVNPSKGFKAQVGEWM